MRYNFHGGRDYFSLEFRQIQFTLGERAWFPEWEVSGHSVAVARKQGLSRKWGQL